MADNVVIPINFNKFNVFEFYNKYKNQNRIYFFDLLNKFNLFSERENDLGITFDSLTKLGLLLENVDIKNNESNELNNFFLKLILNPLVGYAFPLFKYKGNIYSSANRIIKTIKLTNDFNELNHFMDTFGKTETVIFELNLLKNKKLNISYQEMDKL